MVDVCVMRDSLACLVNNAQPIITVPLVSTAWLPTRATVEAFAMLGASVFVTPALLEPGVISVPPITTTILPALIVTPTPLAMARVCVRVMATVFAMHDTQDPTAISALTITTVATVCRVSKLCHLPAAAMAFATKALQATVRVSVMNRTMGHYVTTRSSHPSVIRLCAMVFVPQ